MECNYINTKQEWSGEYLKDCEQFAKEVKRDFNEFLEELKRITLNVSLVSKDLSVNAIVINTVCKVLQNHIKEIERDLQELFKDFEEGKLKAASPILDQLKDINIWLLHVALNLEMIAVVNPKKTEMLIMEHVDAIKRLRKQADEKMTQMHKQMQSLEAEDTK